MATKKQLRTALQESLDANEILETNYNRLSEDYDWLLSKYTVVEKELQKMKDVHFSPLMMEVDRILAQKRSNELFTTKQ